MKRYNPKEIEPKWQKIWEDTGIYRADDGSLKPKKYILEYFPYPSGAAMHVGHVRNYTIGDAMSRYYRMRGFNVLHPMGWDAFGLPAENYAIKNNISPRAAIDENTQRFKQQLIRMGFSYDWTREIDSTDPGYYKWTQWFFLFLFEKGLAYQKDSLQWWCPHDKTVLANEQVEDGRCWRCGNFVEKKSLKQWLFKITDYADRLENDLDKVDWSAAIKTQQRNWIGKSRGAEVEFQVEGQDEKIKVFTTRPDTIYGATFLAVAPEHEILNKLSKSEHRPQIDNYIQQTQSKSEIDRMDTSREITGVFTGAYALNPANQKKIPVWVSDYVLPGYGTGAIMSVPAHDERDWHFAQKFELPVVHVFDQKGQDESGWYAGEGTMKNSGQYDGMATNELREKIVKDLAESGVAEEKVNYKIRDWLISRQRYWGAPIPIIHCPDHGAVAVPEDQLPVVLPELADIEPSGDGRSPLANVPEFVNTTCPKCGSPAMRETDTMDGFACSSWYFLRFADPHNDHKPFDKNKIDFWLPVDDYIGGAEHAVMHLLYARFWTKVMYDEGMINFNEPFSKLRNQGMILAPDGQKMSKSKNNTIEPEGLINDGYGADSIRLMELFIGPWDQAVNWSTQGIAGMYRFLQRVWTLTDEFLDADKHTQSNFDEVKLTAAVHRTIKKVTVDLESMNYNTAIAAMMSLVNEFYKIKAENNMNQSAGWQFAVESLVKLLSPFAPHIAEELWSGLGHEQSVHITSWPSWDENLLKEEMVTLAVQINGKVRSEILVVIGIDEHEAINAAQNDEKIRQLIDGKEIVKAIYIPGRLVSLVVAE